MDQKAVGLPRGSPTASVSHENVVAPAKATGIAKRKPGAAWKENEEHHLPENRIYVVFSGLCLCVFLAALGESYNKWIIC